LIAGDSNPNAVNPSNSRHQNLRAARKKATRSIRAIRFSTVKHPLVPDTSSIFSAASSAKNGFMTGTYAHATHHVNLCSRFVCTGIITQGVTPVPPQHAGPPQLPLHAATPRVHRISILAAPQRTVWVTWYAGPTRAKDKKNYVVIGTSGDGGKTWKVLLTVDPTAPAAPTLRTRSVDRADGKPAGSGRPREAYNM
jgi:hypothetical protein